MMKVGDKRGHFEILEPLGAGATGEVLAARDESPGRRKALKVLPEAVAADPEGLVRFQRKARAVAALTHPNVVVLHSLEESEVSRFLGMEHVSGPPLARIPRGNAHDHEDGLHHPFALRSEGFLGDILGLVCSNDYGDPCAECDAPADHHPRPRREHDHAARDGREAHRRRDGQLFGRRVMSLLCGHRTIPARALRIALSLIAAAVLWSPAVGGSPPSASGAESCGDLLPPLRVDDGREVGPDDCLLLEAEFQYSETPYRRIDIGLSGTSGGYFVDSGARSAYFTSAPEFVFVQTGSSTDWISGTVRYEAAHGAGIALVLPGDVRAWNGKLWLSVHGAGRTFFEGGLRRWDRRVPAEEALHDFSEYERRMLAKGYAVAKSFRSTGKARGDCVVTPDQGLARGGFNITETPEIQLDWLAVAVHALVREYGERPRRIYYYGHSAGGRNGRLINYTPGLNSGRGTWPRLDGFLIDDAGTGLWLPVLSRDGEDILFSTAAGREAFAPQIDVTHQLYLRFNSEPVFEAASHSYLLNKWTNARLLRDKGLGDRHRMYEVRGVSHSGGEYTTRGPREGVDVLPLWRLMDGFVDLLDAWVDHGTPPPPTRSDWSELSDLGALQMPEVACPLGVYFPYPPVLGTAGVGTTGFTSFDGVSEEPRDGRGVFVDMNRNGIHDYRESVSEAWARLGIVPAGEVVTAERYRACVETEVAELQAQGFLTPAGAELYRREASGRQMPAQ